MTKDRRKKLAARGYAAGTGLSYTASLRSLGQRQGSEPGGQRPGPPPPAGLGEAHHRGTCALCRTDIYPGAQIAAHQGHWGHAQCIGGLRPDLRSWLEGQARSHPSAAVPLLIAAGYAAAGDSEHAQRYTTEADAAIRRLAAPLAPPAPPQPARDPWDVRDRDEEPLLTRAGHLLHEVASGTVPGTELMEAAGCCLQQLDLGYAADAIRSTYIPPAPDGPGTPGAVTARRALEVLGEASRVGRRGDEDWTHCQELITWAGKLALGRLQPTQEMPEEVWECWKDDHGGCSTWLEI
jgi:hypothetical protein